MTTTSQAVERLVGAQRIAVVGVSEDESKPSHYVSAFLQARGREIYPVNPNVLEVLGKRSYAKLDHVPGPAVDLVLVFRRAEACGEVAREAVAIGAKGIWLQSGIRSAEARSVAEEAGMAFVEDRCLMVEVGRAVGQG